jgi:sulfhydrogenase subunit beta (sulfur reductase)
LKFLATLERGYTVVVPVKKGRQRFYQRFSDLKGDIVIGEVRAFEPLKAFFSHAREKVAAGFSPELPPSDSKPYAIVGVKACDLKGFKVQDFVFKDCDPFYIRNRENNFIVSADCTCAIETCFCLSVGVVPTPREDFDLNLSQVSGGFVVETGSAKGEAFVNQNQTLFAFCDPTVIKERDAQRAKVKAEVDDNIKRNEVPPQESFPHIIERNYESAMWNDEAKTCVECGACNTVCPTCHCFLLYDQKDQKTLERFRIWDSCMIKDFAQVAGGHNPRPKLWMRLRNRFEKKFDFFPKVAKVYACTGCGRCISACPAKIDIRRVLKRLVANG